MLAGMWKRKPSRTIGGNVNWCSRYRKAVRSYYPKQGTASNLLGWNMMDVWKKEECTYMYEWVTLFYHRKLRNIINQPYFFLFLLLLLLLFFFFCFLGPHLCIWNFPGWGSSQSYSCWPTPQPDPSCVCNLHRSSRQCRIPNPLSEAKD